MESDNCRRIDNWLDAAPVWYALAELGDGAGHLRGAIGRALNLPEISSVGVPVPRSPPQMALVISEILPMVELIILIEPTASCVTVSMPAIWMPISSVAWRLSGGQRLHLLGDYGEAAAGIAGAGGLNGGIQRGQLVCAATAVMSLITSPIRPAACDSALMRRVGTHAPAGVGHNAVCHSCTCAKSPHRTREFLGRRRFRLPHLLEASSEALATAASRVVLPGIVAQRAGGVFQFAGRRRQRRDDGTETVARVGNRILAGADLEDPK